MPRVITGLGTAARDSGLAGASSPAKPKPRARGGGGVFWWGRGLQLRLHSVWRDLFFFCSKRPHAARGSDSARSKWSAVGVGVGAAVLALALSLLSSLVYAQTSPDSRSLDFAKNFSDHCLSHKDTMQAWRNQLNRRLRKLPPVQASAFLGGQAGDAWYVPSIENEGNMVLSIGADKDLCAVFARRSVLKDTEDLFRLLVSVAPPPYVSELTGDIWTGEGQDRRHTFSFVWSEPKGGRRFLFTLTTSESDIASIQALASVTVLPP